MPEPNFELLFESAPALYLALTPDFKVVAVSNAYLHATMSQREAIVGRGLFEVFPDDPEDTIRQGDDRLAVSLAASLRTVVDTLAPQIMAVQKYSLRRPESKGGGFDVRYWSVVNSPVLDANGAIAYIINRADDVTEFIRLGQVGIADHKVNEELKKRAAVMEAEAHLRGRELMERNQELRVANEDVRSHVDTARTRDEALEATRLKSAFLANMSHEIRTPMNVILGFTQLMRRDPGLTPSLRDSLDAIGRSGEHLLTLINGILEMAKIEAGRVELYPVQFSLHALLVEVDAMFRTTAEAKRLSFLSERAEDVPRYLVADENKLRQIFINLLANAVKFTAQGGISLRVRVRSDAERGHVLEAEVEDTGPGISAPEIQRLFTSFEQAVAGRQSGTGAGLGLAISREFARLMKGDMDVTSEVGRGSIFSFHVQVELGDAALVVERTLPKIVARLAPDQGRTRILIADDRQDNRTILARFLDEVGFTTMQVQNGQEAVQAFDDWKPDLILMDMRMPVMDGREAIMRIRAKPGGKQCKIICVTASAFENTRQEILEAGADDVLTKPFRDFDLYERVRSCLGLAYLYKTGGASVPRASARIELRTADFESVSPALLSQIREAADEADVDRLIELAAQVAVLDARVGAGLRAYAEQFDYARLVDLLPARKLEGRS